MPVRRVFTRPDRRERSNDAGRSGGGERPVIGYRVLVLIVCHRHAIDMLDICATNWRITRELEEIGMYSAAQKRI